MYNVFVDLVKEMETLNDIQRQQNKLSRKHYQEIERLAKKYKVSEDVVYKLINAQVCFGGTYKIEESDSPSYTEELNKNVSK